MIFMNTCPAPAPPSPIVPLSIAAVHSAGPATALLEGALEVGGVVVGLGLDADGELLLGEFCGAGCAQPASVATLSRASVPVTKRARDEIDDGIPTRCC